MNKITEIKHPVISHKLGYLRDKNTDSQMFRRLVSERYKRETL